MPNVMGREFPYTAEGMAAAQQYEQAMGMRGGGMMGFRPIGMEEGGDADMVRLADTLYALMSDNQKGGDERVSNFIRENRTALEMAAAIPDSKFNMLRGALKLNAQMQPMPETMGNLGRISDTDLQILQRALARPMPPTTLGSGVTTNPGFDPATNTYTPPLPESNQPYYPELPRMAGGGIMSLRGY